MPISRELAKEILKYLIDNPSFYFPFFIMCKGLEGNEDFVELRPQKDNLELLEDKNHNTFELWENLQNIDLITIQFLSKGFIEKIINENVVKQIEKSAKDYRKLWKMDLCESVKIEEYGLNEFFGGKAEGFEESIDVIKKYLKPLDFG